MSLVVAVVFGAGAALAYGAGTAAEHAAAQEGPGDARGLLALLRNPRWLLGLAGDGLGLVLQVAAIATGPVVIVQPLLVLALPVSLPIRWWLGGPRPVRGDYASCALVAAGLAGFFAIVGNPGDAAVIAPVAAAVTSGVFLAVGAAVLLAARGRPTTHQALVLGAVAGAWFGLVAVLMDAVAAEWSVHGIAGLGRASGLVPLVALLVLGGLSIAATQRALQIGELGASFPANLAADPVTAVVLGAALLHEDVPVGPAAVAGYAACFAVVLAGTIRLARR